jgi:hypothetical protein
MRIERIWRIQFREDRGPEEENRRKRSKTGKTPTLVICFPGVEEGSSWV